MLKTILAAVVASFATAAAADPLVIAHRGASGYLPEHTLEAYAMAYAMGADFIEPDVVLTKDDVFICLHDIHLEATTDVEEQFPDRKRADGRWYAIDFTLGEIKALNVHERIEGRYPMGMADFEVPTLAEMIELVQGLNAVTGKTVGIYPELKSPSFHIEEGHPMEGRFLDILSRYGYASADAPVYVQCFEPDTLKRLRNEHHTPLKLVQLIGDDERFAPLRTREGIEAIAGYADGIGPDKADLLANPAMAEWARAQKLEIHPYTFRADHVAEGFDGFAAELTRYFNDIEVTGVFTDHPDRVVDHLTGMRETE